MAQVSLEKLLKNSDSLYKLVMAAAKRALELAEGSPPLVKSEAKKLTTKALEEIAAGEVRYIKLAETAEKTSKKKDQEADD